MQDLCVYKTSKMVVAKVMLDDGCDGVFLYDDGDKASLDNGSNRKSTP